MITKPIQHIPAKCRVQRLAAFNAAMPRVWLRGSYDPTLKSYELIDPTGAARPVRVPTNTMLTVLS